ncbi:MAG: dihydroorotate dehydrogenase electron transfer subunit [Phycisphaerales bacterium]|nr:dihydroorotate dehydrogenase electron transfer subunit [Phycisphaerales bacterium]
MPVMNHSNCEPSIHPRLIDATVIANTLICREHFRITFECADMTGARAGQFVHLAPARSASHPSDTIGTNWSPVPLLRRAFSIAGLVAAAPDRCHIDVIYRVVGTATRWMASLRVGDSLSVMGPLGNCFPLSTGKRHAWMVAGGVGLPPMLWLAEALRGADRDGIAFVGARSRDLLALTVDRNVPVSIDGTRASPAAREFARHEVPVVISTDDGTFGFAGRIGGALRAYFAAAGVPADDLVVYTCGPEAMMADAARFCAERGIECHVCMERAMACGTGTCQSCVVAVHEPSAVDGWRYELCCTQGPVFDAGRVIWSGVGGAVQH